MLKIEGLIKRFGGLIATNDVSLEFATGSLNAVIGPNGAGKTTLFNLITGHLRPDTGRVLLDDEDLVGLKQTEIVRKGLARAFQVASIFPTLTVREAMAASVQSHRGEWRSLWGRFASAGVRQRADELLELLGLTDVAEVLSRNLSHGDQKLLDIGLALAAEPRVLLLDEPTAGMGPEERWQMIEKVQALWKGGHMTLIFIEHDMDIVFKIAQTVRVLRYGAVLAEGSPEEIRNNPEVIEAYLGHPETEAA
ncbi:MAG: ABC transporter ATP-binding protein [Rhodospirillales bacterium]|jgi:branched-chain amino acid transport system ATP-binding protein|nr:ABC transporter ATP-binding protein [Rhodospirillales bacterium]